MQRHLRAPRPGSLAIPCAAIPCAVAMLVAQPLPRIQLEPVWPELKLERPVWMEEIPDDSGRFLIAEQAGRVWILEEDDDGSEAAVFLDLNDRSPSAVNPGRLLGLACHPDFEDQPRVYLYHTRPNPKRSVLSEFRLAADDPNTVDPRSERILLEIFQPDWNHDGGQVSFGPDGLLYISSGGGGANDPHPPGQHLASLLGKILRIDVDSRTGSLPYGIPADNPFVSQAPDVRPEIWAYGLRNPWRMSWDRSTGELWVGDRGQGPWESVHRIQKGRNHGPTLPEGPHPLPPGQHDPHPIPPIIQYPHSALQAGDSPFPGHAPGTRITGGIVYRGREQAPLRGLYLYADFTLGTFFGLREVDGEVIQYGVLLDQPAPIAGFAQNSDGELFVLAVDSPVLKIRAAR